MEMLIQLAEQPSTVSSRQMSDEHLSMRALDAPTNLGSNLNDSDTYLLEPEGAAEGPHYRVKRRMWNPLWLHRWFLLGFAALLFTLLASTIIIYVVSVEYNGLATQSTSYRYTWIYGPTAGIEILIRGTFQPLV